MTRLIHLSRHGQTVWHAENRYAGVSDVDLTPEGRAQAAGLARWAATQGLGSVYSSHLVRAVETAGIVAAAAGVPHHVDPDLRESDFGAGEGLTRAEMAERFPQDLAAFLAAPATHPLPGGEPGAAAADRFLAALQRLSGPEEAPVLVVAHTTVLRLALCRLLEIPLDGYRTRFPEVGNATVTSVRLGSDGTLDSAGLLRFNTPV